MKNDNQHQQKNYKQWIKANELKRSDDIDYLRFENKVQFVLLILAGIVIVCLLS
jgi:hypothetical protein